MTWQYLMVAVSWSTALGLVMYQVIDYRAFVRSRRETEAAAVRLTQTAQAVSHSMSEIAGALR